jgi:hypothetical protein
MPGLTVESPVSDRIQGHMDLQHLLVGARPSIGRTQLSRRCFADRLVERAGLPVAVRAAWNGVVTGQVKEQTA